MELPDPVRQRLGNFSRTVFSDSNRTGPEYSEGPGEWTRPSATDNEMVSSLGLQMSLYFNTYFFPLWWISSIMMLQMKYSILPDYYKFIVVTVIILITLIEAIRLYLGYMGNLQEKNSRRLSISCHITPKLLSVAQGASSQLSDLLLPRLQFNICSPSSAPLWISPKTPVPALAIFAGSNLTHMVKVYTF
ncbi:transmembrane protein 17 isoform X3 [Neovison vison]|uniref:transmembrane protein 17 isoform X3 n=1 Tax=Neovison vison TaxID=452646 RepID=UPI001CF0B735|nr:transmembrane protein 17 isoform X3 [Neogale vison]